MNYQKLEKQIHKKKSFLCVGLDSDINKIPQFLRENINPILDFNKAIIDATAPYVVAYKLNTAFYEVMGDMRVGCNCNQQLIISSSTILIF